MPKEYEDILIDPSDDKYKMDPDKCKFPLCLVIKPMSFTSIIPIIAPVGDTAIGDSKGELHFYTGDMKKPILIGDEYHYRYIPCKYVKLDLKGITEK